MALKQESKLIQSHIREVRSGKSAAFEQLYNVHAGRIYTFGLKFFNHSKYSAEELTKRVFITAFKQINTYPENITFILWLQKFVVEELRKGEIQKGDEIHQVSPVDEAIFLLPEEERIIFILNDIEKLNTDEMIEVVNEPVENINAKLDSARKRMLQELSADNLTELDYKVNFVSKKPEPRDELWDIIYSNIHSFATKDLKEEAAGEVLNVGDAKLTFGEKLDKLKQEKKRKEVFLKPLGLTISRKAFYTFLLILLITAVMIYFFFIKPPQWEVINLAGSPTIKGSLRNIVVSEPTNFESNEFLATNQDSKVLVKIPRTGELILNPNSSVKKDGQEAEITLIKGFFEINKPKGSEPLPVEVHSVTVKDNKAGSYSVRVIKNSAEISSKNISLIITSGDRKVYLLPQYVCEVRPKGKIGLPHSKSAPADLINAINSFSFDENKERLKLLLILCERKDALTLFNALPVVDQSSREIIINKLHSLVTIPPDINPRQISELNEKELMKWLERIEASNNNSF